MTNHNISLLTSFFYFYHQGNYTIVSELLKCGYRSIEAKNQLGQTAVHLAAKSGTDDILNKLIENKASVNCRDSAGYTPLHVSLFIFLFTLKNI